jgi:hypothetical protein
MIALDRVLLPIESPARPVRPVTRLGRIYRGRMAMAEG